MERKKLNTIVIVSLSVISAAGIVFFIYNKRKIKRLNQKISTINEALNQIDNLEVPPGEIPETPVDEADLPNMTDEQLEKTTFSSSYTSYSSYQ